MTLVYPGDFQKSVTWSLTQGKHWAFPVVLCESTLLPTSNYCFRPLLEQNLLSQNPKFCHKTFLLNPLDCAKTRALHIPPGFFLTWRLSAKLMRKTGLTILDHRMLLTPYSLRTPYTARSVRDNCRRKRESSQNQCWNVSRQQKAFTDPGEVHTTGL